MQVLTQEGRGVEKFGLLRIQTRRPKVFIVTFGAICSGVSDPLLNGLLRW